MKKFLSYICVNVINNNIWFILFKFKHFVKEHVIHYLKDAYWQPYEAH